MPHADASNFLPSSKQEAYSHILESAEGLCFEQRNWVCNTANVASLLWYNLRAVPGKLGSINWAGFYVLDPKAENQLILGPFMGKVACQTIKFGRGVCGMAAGERRRVLVEDVEKFPGHIACDGDSRSEIVVPILVNGKTVAVIDIDSTEVGTFDEIDGEFLDKLAEFLAKSCDW